MTNGIDARHKQELKYDVYCISQYLYQRYPNNLFFYVGGGGGVVSIAQLVEVSDSAVLGGVVEVVSSIPAVVHKIFFSVFRHF